MKKLTNKNKETFKTAIIIILAIVVFLGLIYIVSENTGNRSNDKSETNIGENNNGTSGGDNSNPLLGNGEEIKDEEQKELVEMSYSAFKESLKNGEKKIIFLGSEYCSWCTYQKPILNHIMFKYPVDINYLNVGTITNDEYTELSSLHEQLEGFGTPTFIVIENKKVTSVDQGARGISGMVELLKKYKFINE